MEALSQAALKRLPAYLTYLKALPADGPPNISATALAAALGLGEVLVRKDLAAVSGAGRPRVGYVARELICELEAFLGYDNVNDAVLVGAGRLGRALLEYEGFAEYGLNIVAGFDVEESYDCANGKKVFSIDKLQGLCRRLSIKIGVIAAPAEAAQGVCELMVSSGLRAIFNFAPVHLEAPGDILIVNENLAASLAALSGALRAKLEGENA